ncbi:hypothetical protein HF086_001713 [Spodoptera exigua]|uniref:TIR domain-containing protein n=1 Tax=Spodoptera exigua TaxID=7107 RepID=A0A922MNM3_SPOEX|nr:hypothetical protein HF086_001713 [Spodoptera exigua]
MTPSVSFLSLSALQAPLQVDDVENLGDVQEIMITGGLDSLENLSFGTSNVTNITPGSLKHVPKLKSIYIMKNRIGEIAPGLFYNLTHLENITIHLNDIKLQLHANSISNLPSLKNLIIKDCFAELPKDLITQCEALITLDLSQNRITDALAFQGATSLQTISLIGNRLTLKSKDQLDWDYMDMGMYSPFNTLSELKKLDLSHNNISKIFDDWRFVLPNSCQFLSNKITVNLQHNDISSVNLYQPATQSDSSAPVTQPNSSILLDNNPLNCDCRMYNLAMRLQGLKPTTTEPKFNVGNAQCKSPPHLQGDLFKNLSPYDLYCEEMTEEVRFNCTSVLIRPAYRDLYYDCDFAPPFFPNTEQYGVEQLSLKLQYPPNDLSNLTLSLLNLTNIGLQEIPFSPSESVKEIDLSKNNLTEIPIRFIESNTSLYLSSNPFDCSCFARDSVIALRGSSNIKDLDTVSCANGVSISELEISTLCHSNTLIIAEIGGIFLFLLILFTLAFIFSRQIVDHFGHRIFPCCFIDDPDNSPKEYDIFISYAHKDQKYVNKLLPKLENDFKLKVCVHYRDWEVGDFIPDQINRSVLNSRKTIILLSNSFLDSTFANLEFRTAHNLALKEGRERVILIILEDVSKHEKLSEELKYHMKMNTYLNWDDSRFDEKLRRRTIPQLYNKKKFVRPAILKPIFKQATENNLKKALDVHLNSAGQLVNLAQNKKDIENV